MPGPASHQDIGVFGKLPSAGDFLAHNASRPVMRAFQDWAQAETDELARRGAMLPGAAVRFLYRDGSGAGTVLGVMRPSQDSVGRKFPLSVFTYIDPPLAVQQFPSLPAAYAPFVDGASRLLQDEGQQQPGAFFERASALPLPDARELEDARVWTHQALEHTTGHALLEALFGPLQDGVYFHGFNMFLTACRQVRGADPGIATITLECPASDDVQLAFWLLACQRCLQWHHAPPALFWAGTDSPDSRLLVTLGAPSPGLLHFLADPSTEAERLWPMRTQSRNAIEAGHRALPPTLLGALSPPAPTAATLLAALASA